MYFPSLSSRTMVYKGMLTTMQLPQYFPDLRDERCRSAIAIVHSRFSTNTFPSWPLAHPFRFVAHNGEINTVRGNRNRMHAREAMLASAKIPGDLSRLSPICTPEASDSASFDEVLELLHLGGRSLPHAVLMMIPEAWENNTTMDPAERAFWQFHASLMEPWDGPACVTFTDGTLVGAVLDRNGLRPGRWWRTLDDRAHPRQRERRARRAVRADRRQGPAPARKDAPVDTAAGRIVGDDEIKESLAGHEPYGEWLHAGLLDLKTLPDRARVQPNHESVVRRQIAFGYTEEELRILLTPMAASGTEPLGSMGTDTPTAVLSQRSRLLYDYFVELFAQVTNPPLDAIREEVVTSMARVMGPEQNLLEPTAASCRQIVLRWPVLDNDELNKIVHINDDGEHPGLRTAVLRALYDVERGGEGLADALEDLRLRACDAIAKGARTLVISDRDSDHTRGADSVAAGRLGRAPPPRSHQGTHHRRAGGGKRRRPRSAPHRDAHRFRSRRGQPVPGVRVDRRPHPRGRTHRHRTRCRRAQLPQSARQGRDEGDEQDGHLHRRLLHCGTGLRGRRHRQARHRRVLHRHAEPTRRRRTRRARRRSQSQRHRRAYPENPTERVHRRLEVGGEYAFRREGELHLFTPEVVFLLQHSTRTGRHDVFQKYSDEVNRLSREGGTLRGLFDFKKGLRPPVPLDEVESVDSIVTRFNTGAMSYGSISAEAHETMAIAMNNLGGRSNSGEGGEDVDRLYDPQRRSAVKQVASGRFGVTSDYLLNATDIQIKMAQGAKPGEGGQLPGYKVYPNIAKTRHSTPGVGLISPPPHHDIYSIEDLAQLIHDLKNANADARIHVKLVSSVGVGTVAAGVSKAHADVVLISGYDGGTGAAPLTSLKHAGVPWEIGLADTQQTLMLNGLRDRITVQCDGGMRTARDVIVAALLGAEEFGFATAPLVVSGCIMMRVCHLDTCPVGVATQNPELRARFNGKPEFVENYFRFIAEDIRHYLAELGFRSLDEAVGHAEMLDTDEGVAHWKSRGLDLTPVFAVPDPSGERRRTRAQEHGLEEALDRTLIQLAEGALEDAHPVRLELPVRNVNRTVGTLLGSEVTRRYGAAGLPDNTIHVTLTGSAGQSIGAFLPAGITLELIGDANDYVGKGLSGGRVIVRPPDDVLFLPEDNVIAGNTLLFGATSGELYLRGRVGERFAARNSGALTVVEGVGDHACEYMTGGRVVVLGKTGRNMAAGMSGGIAFVLGLDPEKVNTEMVELQRLEPEDLTWLREVIATHAKLTRSTLAASVLSDWPRRSAQFTKVMPRDYRRVLEATLVAKREGRDVDTAIMEASRG